MLKARNLGQDVLLPGFHFEVREFTGRVVFDAQSILYGVEHWQAPVWPSYPAWGFRARNI
jgi:hypothetical protein